MAYTAAFDLGTTAVKGVLISDDRKPVFQDSLPIETYFPGDRAEQNPHDWYRAFLGVSRGIFRGGFKPEEIRGIIMSGQMQDFIPVDKQGEPVGNAVLYSDGRAGEEAAYLNSLLGEERIRRITGNAMDGSIPAAKLLWYRRHEAENYKKTALVLGSPKDYIILKLCGRAVGDITAASTFGLMDIRTKRWDTAFLEALAVPPGLLPELLSCGERAGTVSAAGAEQSGFAPGTPVYAGSGDAGASTLSSGVTKPGEYNVYLGTSGWIATLSRDVLARPGVFNLAAIPPDLYINVVPFLNAGGVHKWISGVLGAEGAGLNFYDHTDSLLEKSEPGSGGLLFLPYLSGERFPVMDPKIRGAYVGLGNETGPAQMARACLEGVAFSIRQGLEAIDPGGAEKISLIGGGAKTPVWRQILADALQSPVTVLGDHSEYLPSIALAGAVFIDQGLAGSYEEFAASLGASRENRRYVPGAPEIMETQYRRYLKLYPALKGLF